MQDISFLLIADSKFRNLLERNIAQIGYFYPASQIWLYDLSPASDSNLEILAQNKKNVVYKRWPPSMWTTTTWIESLTVDNVPVPQVSKDLKSKLKRVIKKYILFEPSFWETKETKLQRYKLVHRIHVQKAYCMLEYAKSCDKRFIFLDADAFLLSRVDELFDNPFDIGVTLRRQSELLFEFNNCTILNSGVIFFNSNSEKAIPFIEAWITEINNTLERITEQTALSRMIHRIKPDIFSNYYQSGILILNDEKQVSVEILPCEEYNYNWVEEGIDYKKVKVVHFKSGRHKQRNADKLIDSILEKARELNPQNV